MRVRWTVEASAELDDILAYIAAQDAGLQTSLPSGF